MDLYLRLADVLIHLREPENRRVIFWPDAPWDRFECLPDQNPDIKIEVNVVAKLPDIPHGPLHFNSNHGGWRLHEAGEGYYFESLHTQWQTPFRRALISRDFSKIQVYALTTRYRNRTGWTPAQVINPIAEICLLTHLGRAGGFMLHASGIVMENGAWIFSGPSGAGKTTLAEFFADRALTRLSDETILIRKSGQGFTAYGTPWPGEGRMAASEKSPLANLFFIRHGRDRHELRSLPVSELSRLFFQQAFLPHWDVEAMENTAAAFQELAGQDLAFELAFLKSRDVVEFLEMHAKAPA